MTICPSDETRVQLTEIPDGISVDRCEPSTKGTRKQLIRAKSKDKPKAELTNMKRKLKQQVTARYNTRTGTEY